VAGIATLFAKGTVRQRVISPRALWKWLATGFVALPKRWIVERTFAWLGCCRRLAKDWECLNDRALTTGRSPFCASGPSTSCCEISQDDEGVQGFACANHQTGYVWAETRRP
jgi:hypothetical protein